MLTGMAVKPPVQGILDARGFLMQQLCASSQFQSAWHAESVFGKPGQPAPLSSKESFLRFAIPPKQRDEMSALMRHVQAFFISQGKENKAAHSLDVACLCLAAALETGHPDYLSLAKIGLCHDVMEASPGQNTLDGMVTEKEYSAIGRLTIKTGQNYHKHLSKYTYSDPVAGWVKTKDLCAKFLNPWSHAESYAEGRALRIFINVLALLDSKHSQSQIASATGRPAAHPIPSEMVGFAVRLAYELGNPVYSEKICASSGLSHSDPSVAGASMFFRLNCNL